MTKFFHMFRGFDWVLFIATLFLIFFGLTVIYSVSLDVEGFSRFDKQIIFLVVGVIFSLVVSRIDYRWLGGHALVWYVLSCLLLISLLLFGTNIRGTTGWFIFGPFSFQPVEFVKIALVVVMAYFLSRENQPGIKTWVYSFGIIAPVLFLLYLQPDFGPIFMILIVWLILNALRGLSRKGWLVLISGIVLVVSALWFGILSDHQKGRVMTFINPGADPMGRGFQVQQSIIAIGSGGITGRGLGGGVQSQLKFLPEAPTDFIFASLLEQLGLVGFLFLFFVWVVLFWRMMRIIRRSQDTFTLYLSTGLLVLVLIQTLVNVAMNLGLAPIVGLPLPFVSYGGSALLSSLILVGIMESMAIRQKV